MLYQIIRWIGFPVRLAGVTFLSVFIVLMCTLGLLLDPKWAWEGVLDIPPMYEWAWNPIDGLD